MDQAFLPSFHLCTNPHHPNPKRQFLVEVAASSSGRLIGHCSSSSSISPLPTVQAQGTSRLMPCSGSFLKLRSLSHQTPSCHRPALSEQHIGRADGIANFPIPSNCPPHCLLFQMLSGPRSYSGVIFLTTPVPGRDSRHSCHGEAKVLVADPQL